MASYMSIAQASPYPDQPFGFGAPDRRRHEDYGQPREQQRPRPKPKAHRPRHKARYHDPPDDQRGMHAVIDKQMDNSVTQRRRIATLLVIAPSPAAGPQPSPKAEVKSTERNECDVVTGPLQPGAVAYPERPQTRQCGPDDALERVLRNPRDRPVEHRAQRDHRDQRRRRPDAAGRSRPVPPAADRHDDEDGLPTLRSPSLGTRRVARSDPSAARSFRPARLGRYAAGMPPLRREVE